MTANRKLKGRPLLTEGKRTKKIDTRFTEDEYHIILELEKHLGISKTDLIRTRVLKNAPAVIVNAKEMISQLDNIGAEMGRSGNNINQLARHANSLNKYNRLTPGIVENFNRLFELHINNQKTLEAVLRNVIRLMGR